MPMLKKLMILIGLVALMGCSQPKPVETKAVSDVNSIVAAEETPEIFKDNARLKLILDQLHFVMPVTDADILWELVVVIESDTGEPDQGDSVKACYADIQSQFDNNAETNSGLVKAVSDYYEEAGYSEEIASDISLMAGKFHTACISNDMGQCPGACLNYTAAKAVSVAKSSGHIEHEDLPEPDEPEDLLEMTPPNE